VSGYSVASIQPGSNLLAPNNQGPIFTPSVPAQPPGEVCVPDVHTKYAHCEQGGHRGRGWLPSGYPLGTQLVRGVTQSILDQTIPNLASK
jgi:hypothetical protein